LVGVIIIAVYLRRNICYKDGLTPINFIANISQIVLTGHCPRAREKVSLSELLFLYLIAAGFYFFSSPLD